MNVQTQTLRSMLERLLAGQDLSEGQAEAAMRELAGGEAEPALAGALLAALRLKGESAAEVRGFARAMRELAIRPELPAGGPVADVVGTGGDGSGSINLSTGAGLLAAACGVRIAKHGNRAVSGKTGSADVLQALGLNWPDTAGEVTQSLAAHGFAFMFAPYFHPAMKSIAPIRAALGVRTVFNLLGPLANPARPPFMLVGAFSREAAALMADTLSGLDIERCFVVHGEPGWDEPTPVGRFLLIDARPGEVRKRSVDPADFGIPRCKPSDLAGGERDYNAATLEGALRGEGAEALNDALVLQAGLVLELVGAASSLREGLGTARDALQAGAAGGLLEDMRAAAP
ncbi:MAG: anthranilate phosphoribosyltransferase [Gammaproteobacteria bacterium]|nr:anthranilate phosphoribosyltransferase [Gammaproteobacteria bacterium]